MYRYIAFFLGCLFGGLCGAVIGEAIVRVWAPKPQPILIEQHHFETAADDLLALQQAKSLLDVAADTAEHEAAALVQARADTAAIVDVAAWHADHDAEAVQGFGRHKGLLGLRTKRLRDPGVKAAGEQFLSAIHELRDGLGKPWYTIDRAQLVGIDPEKLKRWATVALTVLQMVEPFVPPPYNLAVHAAVTFLKLYLANHTAELFANATLLQGAGGAIFLTAVDHHRSGANMRGGIHRFFRCGPVCLDPRWLIKSICPEEPAPPKCGRPTVNEFIVREVGTLTTLKTQAESKRNEQAVREQAAAQAIQDANQARDAATVAEQKRIEQVDYVIGELGEWRSNPNYILGSGSRLDPSPEDQASGDGSRTKNLELRPLGNLSA